MAAPGIARLTRTLNRDAAYPLGAALLFGASAPFSKALVAEGGAQVFAGILYLGSGLVLLLARAARARREAPLQRADLPWLAGATLCGGVLAPVLLVWGLQHTSATAGSLLLNAETVFTAGLAWIVFREHRHARTVAGLLIIVAAGAVLSADFSREGPAATWPGNLAVAAACLCWGLDNNLTQPIASRDPVDIGMWKGLAAGATNLGIGLSIGQPVPAGEIVAGGLLIGALSYGASLVLFVTSLRRLGTSRTAAYFAVAPFVGAVVSIAAFREPLTPVIAAGGALMAVGVLLYVTERHVHRHVHEPLEHAHLHTHDEHHRHEHAPGDPPGEPHSHLHRHERLEHEHPHVPDIHHRHGHD